MSDESSRDLVIFTQALQLPVGERAAFLDRACAGDEDLRRNVEALLRAHDRVGDFLETPPLASGLEAETEDGTPKKKRNLGGNNDGFDHE
jgi:hypothetical protein